ncbi:hypothetical protein [Erwinia amylovora]|uniref:hypothetical protein n=1 Tax=Erwinia amylovora TaxID=552 RepID=UPI000C075F81|nr:hypothetical protein [Erwinia amylovora]
MKLFFSGLIFIASSSAAIAEGEQVVGCFTAGKTNVKYVQLDRDGAILGYVKYQKSKLAIPIVYLEESSEGNQEGGPEQITTKWAEFINGNVNGHYIVVSQGARFYQFEYKSKRNVITKFEDNTSAYNEDGTDCKW